MNSDVLYTPEEIASILKLKKNTIYEIIKRGELEAHRIGKSLRISQSQFDYYLLKVKGSENIYTGEVIVEGQETIVLVEQVKIHVTTAHMGTVKIAIKPGDVILSTGTFKCSARNQLEGKVLEIIEGDLSVKVILDIGIQLVAEITKASLKALEIKKGSILFAVFKSVAVKVYK